MKASPINFRAFLVIASAVILAVLCSYVYTLSRVAGVVLGVLLLAGVACLFVICLLKYKRNTVKLRVVIACGLAFLLSVTAFSVATATFDNWERGLSYGGYRDVYGRVCAVDTRTGSYRIYLENVVLDGDKAPGNICVTISASDNNIADVVKCGDRLSFSAYISAAKLADGYFVDGSAYRTNTRYFATVKSENVKIDFGKPNIIERFLAALKSLLVNNMGDHYGNIAFSLFSGDKHTLYTGVTDYYSAAGLGHILAVSGLHIGFLVIILNLVLFKVGKKARFPIITAVLVLYAVLADFSPSVLRAVIMTVISMLSLFVGGRRDMLSSMLCAGSAILAFKPIYLFEAGFLLSFGSIFGIALFARSITEFFMRHGAHRKVAESIGVSVSVTLGIAPPMIFFFNKLSVLGILVNIVAIPFVSIVYIVLIFTAIIGAIPYAGSVLLLCKYLLVPLDMVAYGISFVPYASITIYSTAAIFLCYPIMFCASEFFMVCKGKPIIVLYSALACIAFCAVGLPRENHALAVVQCSENTSIVCTDGKTYIVGYMGDEYAVRRRHRLCPTNTFRPRFYTLAF